MLPNLLSVPPRFGLFRAIAYMLRVVALVLGMTATILSILFVVALISERPLVGLIVFASLPVIGGMFITAISIACVSETILVLVAIEANTRQSAEAAVLMALTVQKHPDMLAELQKITQHTRYTADDIQQLIRQHQPIAHDVRHILDLLKAKLP